MDSHDSFLAQDSAGSLTPRTEDLASSFSFNTGPDDLDLQSAKRQKSSRDPMSHRIIEKRRRDRMNNCLADLSRLIPTSYLKQGQGRIEKTEIIEMAIKHIKTLQAQVDGIQSASLNSSNLQQAEPVPNIDAGLGVDRSCCRGQFHQGFKECQEEILRCFVEGEAMVASDPFCVRVMDHLSSVAQNFEFTWPEDKKETHMEIQAQQMTAGTFASFKNSSTSTAVSSYEPILPLVPTSGGMMVPASPVRNKQLRGLLSTRALQQLEAEREASTAHNTDHVIRSSSASEMASMTPPPLGTSTSLTSPSVPVSYTSSINDCSTSTGVGGTCDNSLSGGGVSSGYMSDTSTADRFSNGELMMNTKDSSVMNAYKFKHNITKRFSQEGKIISQQYDGSSSASSKEAEDEHHHAGPFKHRSMKNKSRYASSTDSGPYPTSEHSGTNSASSHDSVEGGLDRSWNRKAGSKSVSMSELDALDADRCPRSTMPLPGFVLHPSGTHYMPMSVSYKNIPDVFESNADAGHGTQVFHPISIPVHFRGPVISVPSSSLYSQNSNPTKNLEVTAKLKDTKEIKKAQDI